MRIKCFLVAFLPFLAVAAFAAAEALVNVDFSQVGAGKHIKAQGSFNGPLPNGVVADFPNWNESVATTEQLSDKGRGFLRFDVKHIIGPDQPVLFRLSGAMKLKSGYYEIKVVSRCPDAPLNLHVRALPKPYTTFMEADTTTDSAWRERSFQLQLKHERPAFSDAMPDFSQLALFISLKKGVTDIASVKLLESDKAAFMAVHAAGIERPTKGIANLFRNSRFPLGPQAGWNINRENVGGELKADPANPGPSGAPSLLIRSPGYIQVYSEPFQVDDSDTLCHVSLAYKAKGEWYASVGGVSKGLVPSDKWRIASMSFKPDPLVRGFALVFGSVKGGEFNVDSLMAHSGDSACQYASADECEIALAPEDSELAGTHVLFSDEPAKLKFHATGAFDGATLKAKAVNVYGEERPLSDVKLGRSWWGRMSGEEPPFMESGVLDFGVFPETSLGSFRVEVWAERDGKRVSPFNEIVMSRVRRPVHWGEDAPNSPFGGHFYPAARVVSTMKAAGMNWVRCNDVCVEATCWGWVEREKGVWKFADDKVAAYRDGKIKVLGYLGSAPTWASYFDGVKSSFGYFDYMYQPKDIEAFKNYVRTVTSHYKGVIDEYQFQNEPFNSGSFWRAGLKKDANPPKDYAELSKVAYGELKRVYPEAVFYGFNTGGSWGAPKWTKAVFEAGAYPYCDMIDYHYYNESRELGCVPGDQTERNYHGVLDYFKARVPAPIKPIVNSEGNPGRTGAIPTSLEGKDDFAGLYKHTIPWVSQDDNLWLADMTCRFVASHLALGVKRIFLYSDHCPKNLLVRPSFPVLLGADGYPHPTLAAFSNLAWLLEDRLFVKRVQVGEKVWAYLFAGRGASVALISGAADGRYSVPEAEGLETLDLFGNRVAGKVAYQGRLLYVVSSLPADGLEKTLTAKQ